MEEINKILNLVERADNREEQKKTYRMVEELRKNILELHESLAAVKSVSPKDSPKTSKSELNLTGLMAELAQNIKQEVDNKVTSHLEAKVKGEVEKLFTKIKW